MTNSSKRDAQEDLAYSVLSPCCERLRCAKGRPVVAQQQGVFFFFCALMAGHADGSTTPIDPSPQVYFNCRRNWKLFVLCRTPALDWETLMAAKFSPHRKKLLSTPRRSHLHRHFAGCCVEKPSTRSQHHNSILQTVRLGYRKRT